MSVEDKARRSAQKVIGTIKEGAGKMTGDESLEAARVSGGGSAGVVWT